ncbi:class I SAM-dependent methyltransferase [Kribbella sp. NPDC058245]|uniref:class I SAM-dependent methyltransferase n=1 Tax=Kribbella sp. NPDC058245 TaxID=3346399 RepID=UPI0036E98CAC
MRVGQGGSGPGARTPDGSAIEMYELGIAHGEDELIDAAIEPKSSILELGCGTGRITRPLLARGHQVVAVDESAEMIARVPETETIQATIGELRLDREFDVVLMMSYLINVADDAERLRLLQTCAHHVRPGGSVVLQQQLPSQLAKPVVLESERGRMEISDVEHLPGNQVAATVTHTIGGRSWSQRVLTQNLTEEQLAGQLVEAGLRLDEYLTPDTSWVRARPI